MEGRVIKIAFLLYTKKDLKDPAVHHNKSRDVGSFASGMAGV
jgi:hypothetical protein